MTKSEIEIISTILNSGSCIVLWKDFKYVDRLIEMFPLVYEEKTVCGVPARLVGISDHARRFIVANSKGI
jgi:hypothetical protein